MNPRPYGSELEPLMLAGRTAFRRRSSPMMKLGPSELLTLFSTRTPASVTRCLPFTGISQQTFVVGTGILAAGVFLVSYLLALWAHVFIAEYLVGLALLGHVSLVSRREQAIRWQWPWRRISALILAAVTYLFVASAYAPSPQPFEPAGLFETQAMILQHYAVFLMALVPLVIVSRDTMRTTRQPFSRAIVTRIL